MFDRHPAAELHGVRQIYAVGVADFSVERSVQNAQRSPQQFWFYLHPPDAEPLNCYGPKSRFCPVASVSVPVFFYLLPKSQFWGFYLIGSFCDWRRRYHNLFPYVFIYLIFSSPKYSRIIRRNFISRSE